jgi:hypothetical protein
MMLTMSPRDTTLLAWCVVGSIAAHVLLLTVLPGLQKTVEPPAPLVVELVKPPDVELPKPLPVEKKPPPPEPVKAKPEPQKPAPREDRPVETPRPILTAPHREDGGAVKNFGIHGKIFKAGKRFPGRWGGTAAFQGRIIAPAATLLFRRFKHDRLCVRPVYGLPTLPRGHEAPVSHRRYSGIVQRAVAAGLFHLDVFGKAVRGDDQP